MLGDIGRIPIITLSGCKSLSEILSDLPLPQPCPQSHNNEELIVDARLLEAAATCLCSTDDWLVETLASALENTSSDNILLKNDTQPIPIDFHTLPPLLKETISRKPSMLENNRSFRCIYSSKEVLQILSGGANGQPVTNSSSRITSPKAASQKDTAPKSKASKKSSASVQQAIPKEAISNSRLYSVVSVEPLKLSIKRSAHMESKKKQKKQRHPKVKSQNLTTSAANSRTSETTKHVPMVTIHQINAPNTIDSNQLTLNNNLGNIPTTVSNQTSTETPVMRSPSSQLMSEQSRLSCENNITQVPHENNKTMKPIRIQIQLNTAINRKTSESIAAVHPLSSPIKTQMLAQRLLQSDSLNEAKTVVDEKSASTVTPLIDVVALSGASSCASSVLPTVDSHGAFPVHTEEASSVPRSPLSVPSNCSFPSTPSAIQVHLNTTSPHTIGSAINLFGAPLSLPQSEEALSNSAPRGLAAYLKKPKSNEKTCEVSNALASPATGNNFHHHHQHSPGRVVVGTNNASLIDDDAYTHQHGSAPPMQASSPWSGVNTRHNNVNTTGTFSSSLSNTPTMGQELQACGKRRGGRTRRSEIEELMIWRVRDPKKLTPNPSSPLPEVGLIEHQQPVASPPRAPPPPAPTTTTNSSEFLPLVSSDTEPFAEAMGERIKRRRQLCGGKLKMDDDDSDDQKPPNILTTPRKVATINKKASPSIPAPNIPQQLVKHVIDSAESDISDRLSDSSDLSTPSKFVNNNNNHENRRHTRVLRKRVSQCVSSLESFPSPLLSEVKCEVKKEYIGGESSSSLSDSSMPDVNPVDLGKNLPKKSDQHHPPKLYHMNPKQPRPFLKPATTTTTTCEPLKGTGRRPSVRSSVSPPPLLPLPNSIISSNLNHSESVERKYTAPPKVFSSSSSSNESHKASLASKSKLRASHSRSSIPKIRSPISQQAMPSVKKSLPLSTQKHQSARIHSSPSNSDSSEDESLVSAPRRPATMKSSTISQVRNGRNSGGEGSSLASSLSSDDQLQQRRSNKSKREGTPSTVPCTSSSDSDGVGDHLPPRRPSNSSSSPQSVDSPPDQGNEEPIADEASKDLPLPSPASVSSSQLSDFKETCLRVEEADAAKRRIEELTNSAAALAEFTAHISDILRRIGELDMLKVANNMQTTTSKASKTKDDADYEEEEEEEKEEDRTPPEARLSRREISALYQESAQVRVAGSISNVRTGHLVRLLTVLLVNIRDAANLVAPNPTPLGFKEMIQRQRQRKLRLNVKHGGSIKRSEERLSESLLWSHPLWFRVLRGLDSALIALNIITGPDIPRPLLMEDLIEAIAIICHFQFTRLIAFSAESSPNSKRNISNAGAAAELATNLTALMRDSVGSRISECLTGLSSLVRLHPGRFNDSLVLRLTDLSLIFSNALLTPISPSPRKLGVCTAAATLLPEPVLLDGSQDGEKRQFQQLDYYVKNQWRLQLQRSSLGLIGAIFAQYDKHRQEIADGILSSLSVRTNKVATEAGAGSAQSATNSRRALARTFWILASGSFVKGWQPFQLQSRIPPTPETVSPTKGTPTNAKLIANNCYLLVHSFSALLMAVVQALIPAPLHLVPTGSGRKNSSTGGGGGASATPNSSVSQQSTATATGFSDHGLVLAGHGTATDAILLAKEEKSLLTAYSHAMRTAHCLLSGLFKRVTIKGEDDLKPLLEVVLVDCLRVAADSPVEWPVANLLLNVLGKVLIQQLNGSSSSSSRSQSPTHSSTGRGVEVSVRLIAADNLAILAGGLRCLFKLRGGASQPMEIKLAAPPELTEAKTSLSSFLQSPVMSLHHLTLAFDDTPCCVKQEPEGGQSTRLQRYMRQRDFVCQLIARLRFQHFDGLTVASKRFHLVSWLHDVSHELSANDGISTAASSLEDQTRLDVEQKERRRIAEELRRNFLVEFAGTHHSIAGVAPWLPPKRRSGSSRGGGGTGGSMVSPGCESESSSLATFCLYTGHGLGADGRRRRTAVAHKLATRIAQHVGNSPDFDLLFAHIVNLLCDPAIPLRARALKCLSSLVDISPDCISPPPAKNLISSSPSSSSNLLSMIPARMMDSSPAVRESAVELVGRLISTNTAFIPAYYAPLVERVLDLCVSVRKRAVRSLQALLYGDSAPTSCLSMKQLVHICVVLIRRLNDEENVKKLVLETFLNFWFTPIGDCSGALVAPETDTEADSCDNAYNLLTSSQMQLLGQRVTCLCEVMSNFRNRGFHIIEDLMGSVLKTSTSDKSTQVVDRACKQIVDYLSEIIQHNLDNGFAADKESGIKTQEHSKTCPLHVKHHHHHRNSVACVNNAVVPNSCTCGVEQQGSVKPSLASCLSVLHLMAKCHPSLMYRRIPMLVKVILAANNNTSQDSTATTFTNSNNSLLESTALSFATGTIEVCCLQLAASKRFSETKLAKLFPEGLEQFEETLIVLLQRHNRVVVDSALACLSTIVNKLTQNYSRVTCCFAQFYDWLIKERRQSTERLKKTQEGGSAKGQQSSTSVLLMHPSIRPTILRALYTVGLICKHFSLEDLATTAFDMINDPTTTLSHPTVNLSVLTQQATFGTSLRDEVFNTLMYFAENALRLGSATNEGVPSEETTKEQMTKKPPSSDDVELGKKAIAGLSFLANRHDHLFCSARLQTFFRDILSGLPLEFTPSAVGDLQCIILDCLTNFLVDEEKQMLANDVEWATNRKSESLKELGDRRDGHGCAVAQVYLSTVLDHCILSPTATVRSKALSLISTILRQGLVHPVQTIACLVCLQTDPEDQVRTRATQQLNEAEQKLPGFAAMKAEPGIRIGFRLQCLVAATGGGGGVGLIRGASNLTPSSKSEDEKTVNSDSLLAIQSGPLALNHGVYRILQTNRKHRRSLIHSLVSLFDLDQEAITQGVRCPASSPSPALGISHEKQNNKLAELIYISDQLAHFPYKYQDEVNYLAHNVDLRVSSLGSAVVRILQECLASSSRSEEAYDRKVTNLIEDAESELFSMGEEAVTSRARLWTEEELEKSAFDGKRPFEQRLLERVNRPIAAAVERWQKARALIVRNAPSCLLLMAVRKHLKEAYDVTSSKLAAYSSSSGDEKQWQKPISLSARCLQAGVFRRLLEIPGAVEQCASTSDWPVTAGKVVSADRSPPSDRILLRLALLLHRQLLAMDDEGELGGSDSAFASAALNTSSTKLTTPNSSEDKGKVEDNTTISNKSSELKESAKMSHNSGNGTNNNSSGDKKKRKSTSLRRKNVSSEEDKDSLSSLSELNTPVRKMTKTSLPLSAVKPSPSKKSRPDKDSQTGQIRQKSTKTSAFNEKNTAPKKCSSNDHLLKTKNKPEHHHHHNPQPVKKSAKKHTLSSSLSSLSSLEASSPDQHRSAKQVIKMSKLAKLKEKPSELQKCPKQPKHKAPPLHRYEEAPLPSTPDSRFARERRRRHEQKKRKEEEEESKSILSGGSTAAAAATSANKSKTFLPESSSHRLHSSKDAMPFKSSHHQARPSQYNNVKLSASRSGVDPTSLDVDVSSVSSVSSVSTPSDSSLSET